MKTGTITLLCVGSADHELRGAAHRLALTGRPVLGRPSTEGARFANDPVLVILLAVRGDTPVGVVTWECPGPSRRIPSARVTSAAVDNDLGLEETVEVVHTMALGVPVQFEYVLTRLGGRASGYVVADLPRTSPPYNKMFLAAGWLGLQAADQAKTVRHVAFVHPSPSADPKASDEPHPAAEGDEG